MKVMNRKKVMFTGLAAGAALCAFGLTAIPGNVHKLAAVQAEETAFTQAAECITECSIRTDSLTPA